MKKIYLLIMLILFVFIFSCSSYAETLDTFEYNNNTYTLGITDTLFNSVTNLNEFGDTQYTMFCFLTEMQLFVQFIPSSYNTKVYLDDISSLNPYGGGWVYFHYTDEDNIKDNTDLKWYSLNEGDAQISNGGTGLANFYNKRTYRGNDYINFYSTMSIYTDSTLTDLIYQASIPSSSYNPVLLNADTTKYGNTLENGKFNYFYINSDGLPNLTFRVIDNTLSSDNVNTFTLNSSSSYCYDKTLLKYAVPKSALTFGYNDEHEYDFILSWVESATPYSVTYNVTTNFKAPTIINGVQNDLYSIDFEIQNISGVLLDSNINTNTIIDNMPISSSYVNPVNDGISGVFNAFYNAFTSTTGTTVRFYVPYSNGQYIDLPANLVSSHLPEPVITLIQTIYWAFICIFIIKDISNLAELAKSGDILDAKTGNIKTEML